MSGNNDTVYLVNGSTLTNIANAIREKTGKTDKLYPSNMDEEITSISTGYQPITVNITQSEHQTIRVTPSKSFGSLSSSGNVSCPTGLILTATVTPDSGYQAGTLNQTTVNNAEWGNTYTFSATAATVIPMVTVNFIIEWVGDNDNANNTRFDSGSIIYESGTNSSTIPLNSSNNWTYSKNLKANTTYHLTLLPPSTPIYTSSGTISSFTTSSVDNQTITIATYTYTGTPTPTPPA